MTVPRSTTGATEELKDLLKALQDPSLGGEAYAELVSHMVRILIA